MEPKKLCVFVKSSEYGALKQVSSKKTAPREGIFLNLPLFCRYLVDDVAKMKKRKVPDYHEIELASEMLDQLRQELLKNRTNNNGNATTSPFKATLWPLHVFLKCNRKFVL